MTGTRLPWLLALLVTAAMAAWLLAAGRTPICPCGYVLLWDGAGDSLHIADWYTPSHIIHGLIFFGLLWLVARRLALGWRLLLATLVEAGWELLENSDAVIERYRTVTVSQDYFGDSVLNSVFDIVAMWIGFALARTLPVWASVALALAFEALTAFVIRDGLALNVLMLLWPSQAILDWQAGG